MLVATSDLEMERMRALWERTAANGIEREWLNADELREREPNITGLGGIFVPSSGIVSYRDVTAAMAKSSSPEAVKLSITPKSAGLMSIKRRGDTYPSGRRI